MAMTALVRVSSSACRTRAALSAFLIVRGVPMQHHMKFFEFFDNYSGNNRVKVTDLFALFGDETLRWKMKLAEEAKRQRVLEWFRQKRKERQELLRKKNRDALLDYQIWHLIDKSDLEPEEKEFLAESLAQAMLKLRQTADWPDVMLNSDYDIKERDTLYQAMGLKETNFVELVRAVTEKAKHLGLHLETPDEHGLSSILEVTSGGAQLQGKQIDVFDKERERLKKTLPKLRSLFTQKHREESSEVMEEQISLNLVGLSRTRAENFRLSRTLEVTSGGAQLQGKQIDVFKKEIERLKTTLGKMKSLILQKSLEEDTEPQEELKTRRSLLMEKSLRILENTSCAELQGKQIKVFVQERGRLERGFGERRSSIFHKYWEERIELTLLERRLGLLAEKYAPARSMSYTLRHYCK